MSRSLKFPVAVHVMVAMAEVGGEFVSSEVLAKSVATNAVVVRRILQALKKSKLVESMGGVYGGTRLARPADEITLRDVYQSVEAANRCEIHEPCPECCVARTIRKVVPEILNEVEAARLKHLEQFNVAQILGLVERRLDACSDDREAATA